MNLYYNQNYTKEEIKNILELIKECVKKNDYTIAMNKNRKENIDFINEYNIRSKKQKLILLQLQINDFCHTLQNRKVGYENEILYVFAPNVDLYDANDIKVAVNIYIKINIIYSKNGNKVAVISFHKLNKSINYLFR